MCYTYVKIQFIGTDVIGLFILTVILLVMLIPLSVLAGRRMISRDSTSGLRSAFTVVQAGMVLLIILGVFEMGYSTILYYSSLPNGYDDVNISFLRYAETALLSLYWIVVLVTELLHRKKGGLRLSVIYPVAVGVLILICAGLSVLVFVNNKYYFDYSLYAVIGVGIVSLLHITNMLLSFKTRWQRKVITAVNGGVFAVMVALAVIVVRMGSKQIVGSASMGVLICIGIAAIIFLMPSVICIGSVVAEQLKKN